MGREFQGRLPDWFENITAAEVHRMTSEEVRTHPNRTWLISTAFAHREWEAELRQAQ